MSSENANGGKSRVTTDRNWWWMARKRWWWQWPTKFGSQLAKNRLRSGRNTVKNGGVAEGECNHSEGRGWSQKLGRGDESWSGWSASPEVAHRCQKMPRKTAVVVGLSKTNVIAGGDYNGIEAISGSQSKASHEGNTKAVVRWQENGRSLTYKGPNEGGIRVENVPSMWEKSQKNGRWC